MTEVIVAFSALAAGYLVGSLNSSIIVGWLLGTDIRHHGSKSAGLTNALRVLGKTAAFFVLAGDIMKGIVSCLLGAYLGSQFLEGEVVVSLGLLAAGAGAVAGHNWPLYFGFKGCPYQKLGPNVLVVQTTEV